MKANYSLGDISVIIPTYNRTDDLKITLESFRKDISLLKELIIVDQSTNKDIANLVKKLKIKKLKYFHRKEPSLTAARNYGVLKASGKLICFFDDDITIDEDYFNQILKVFNENGSALGVSGWFFPDNKKSKLEILLRRLFFIERVENNKMSVSSAYGNNQTIKLSKVINAEWISGFNMTFKREVFNDFKFDEKLVRYALGEDFDFTYRIYKKSPNGLFLTPNAKIVHRASIVERNPTRKAAYMNQINHFYINYKNFNSNLPEKAIFVWCLFGISLLRILNILKTRRKEDYLKARYFFESLIYTIKNIDKIKKGDLKGLYVND